MKSTLSKASSDTRPDQRIRRHEFENALEMTHTKEVLHKLSLDKKTLMSLFSMLDIESEGQVSITDLILSMQQSKESVDVLTLRFESKRLAQRLVVLSHTMQAILTTLQNGDDEDVDTAA